MVAAQRRPRRSRAVRRQADDPRASWTVTALLEPHRLHRGNLRTRWPLVPILQSAILASFLPANSPAAGQGEECVDDGLELTGVPLDLGEEEAALDHGEEGDREVVRVDAAGRCPAA